MSKSDLDRGIALLLIVALFSWVVVYLLSIGVSSRDLPFVLVRSLPFSCSLMSPWFVFLFLFLA